MGSLVFLFALVLSMILLASYQDIYRKNTEMLDRYIELYSLDHQPGGKEKPEEGPVEEVPLDMPPDYQLSTFYSVALDREGTVLAIDEGGRLYSQKDLIDLSLQLLHGNETHGKISHLRYRIAEKEDYVLVAFIDVTLIESDMRTLVRNVSIVGSASIVVMLIISFYLSDKIIQPLEDNDKRQRQFVSDASHELKTPIAVIDANAELLSRQIQDNEWLSNIQYENRRMGELVKQLLELSHAEKKETKKERIDFSRIVNGELLAFESLAFDLGKTMIGDIKEGIFLLGDRIQFTRLVSILLDNAIRHSSEHSDIEVSLVQDNNRVILKTVNEGKKIEPEAAEHLFDRFYRADQARNSEGYHYGLGLAIAKAIVDTYEGSIDVSCYDGKIEFCVFLPLR